MRQVGKGPLKTVTASTYSYCLPGRFHPRTVLARQLRKVYDLSQQQRDHWACLEWCGRCRAGHLVLQDLSMNPLDGLQRSRGQHRL